MELSRRSILAGLAATAALGLAPAHARHHRARAAGIDPVLYWNGVALELVALDHSIDVADARAPGPCASARALGVVHAVIADAVHFAYRAPYRPLFYRGPADFRIESPELFVGGAASAILTHIYSTSMHAYALGLSAEAYRRSFSAGRTRDWDAGIAFGRSAYFRQLWEWDEMQRLLLPQFSTYVPRARSHSIDPYNSGQGFYGSSWGGYSPLVLQGSGHVAALAPEAPPPEGSPEYERDAAEVRVKGALRSRSDGYFSARTPHETNIGLFWAYDGARLLGTPPRLYNQITRQIAIADGLNVVELARLFALCNLAMADASIVAWYAKYRYSVWRPVLGIANHAYAPDPDWLPFGAPRTNPLRLAANTAGNTRETAQALMGGGAFIHFQDGPEGFGSVRRGRDRGKPKPLYGEAAFTPNFPAYPSGHATFGSACFTMLRLLRRERPQTRRNPDVISGKFVSDELNGVTIDHSGNTARPYYPIAYRSLGDMIKDNDLSRIYLGIHWRFDCEKGSESGARIAGAVYDAAYAGYSSAY